jgi:3-oxoisoapionate kinase
VSGAAAALLDGIDVAMLEQAGHLIWSLRRPSQPVFTIGSSGVTASLIAYWRKTGMIPEKPLPVTVTASERILVISGSCSRVTAAQIEWASRQGWTCIPLDAARLNERATETVDKALQQASLSLKAGKDTVLYTALGAPSSAHEMELGGALGHLLLDLVRQTGVRRVVLCGGDTSSHAVQQLGLTALTFAGILAPGAPLCRAHAEPDTGLDGLELVLKGGQMGQEDFFRVVRDGK